MISRVGGDKVVDDIIDSSSSSSGMG